MMSEKREELAELQWNVARLRVKCKEAIIKREKQNVNIELDILERTKVISLYKLPKIEVPQIEPINFPTPIEPEVDIDELYNKAKELKCLMEIYLRRSKCSLTKLLQEK